MLYFAYGSHLDPDRMREMAPDVRVVGLAALHDHRLTFPLHSERWGGGTAGVTHAHGVTVWGVVYELDDAAVAALDAAEGWKGPGDHHSLVDRELATVEVIRTDDGSVPRRVRAVAYFARTLNPTPPSRRYVDTLIKGARHHRLPPEYIDQLRALEAGAI